jgi:hypothetical protein
MHRLLMILLLLGSLSAAFASNVATGRIVKVLPLLLDAKSQDAISPSLYDRDAYQAYLREHTNEIKITHRASRRGHKQFAASNYVGTDSDAEIFQSLDFVETGRRRLQKFRRHQLLARHALVGRPDARRAKIISVVKPRFKPRLFPARHFFPACATPVRNTGAPHRNAPDG